MLMLITHTVISIIKSTLSTNLKAHLANKVKLSVALWSSDKPLQISTKLLCVESDGRPVILF